MVTLPYTSPEIALHGNGNQILTPFTRGTELEFETEIFEKIIEKRIQSTLG
jgi:hypothetical protein